MNFSGRIWFLLEFGEGVGDIDSGMARQKAIAALNAMKAIGIPMQMAKPVLKNLLKVYENNWEYIEAENYRVLADAILDIQESQEKVLCLAYCIGNHKSSVVL